MTHSDTPIPGGMESSIDSKIDVLRSSMTTVGCECMDIRQSLGRVLAQDLVAFRDSPAIDVSAMDGYAVRLQDLTGNVLPIGGIAKAGSAPVELTPGSAVRIFTGGPVPKQADCVVKREDCNESESYVAIAAPVASLSPGLNIRKQGENAKKDTVILEAGTVLSPEKMAAAVTFSSSTSATFFKKVRITILNTGDELFDLHLAIEPWQIRDSNGPYLESVLRQFAWTEIHRKHVLDRLEDITHSIEIALEQNDVILLTGGVSMGDTDYVPDAVVHAGGRILFHRLPIRPGKPMLGAIGPKQQLILGLPGNPVSVAVTFRRFGLDLIRRISGQMSTGHRLIAAVESNDLKTVDLTWFRLARWKSHDSLMLVSNQGSGDIAALCEANGFVEIPPNQLSRGAKLFYPWSVGD